MDSDSVERIGVGDGSAEGRNSAYLVADRVVVDPGPPTDDAWADLRAGLERAAVSLTDLEYVPVTHWHVDHAGLAPRLAAAADATIGMAGGDAPLVADYATERRRRLERDREAMRRWGVPAAAVDGVLAGDTVSPMPDSVPVDRLADGDRIAGLEVVATPGHTLGHAAFAGDDVLLIGDAVLPTYTPNVGGSDTRTLVDGPRAGSTRGLETDPLTAYFETLDRLANRSERLLPGHGTAIESGRITAIRDHQHERARGVLAALERDGNDEPRPSETNRTSGDDRGLTPWELAIDLFDDLEGIHVKFGAGEVAAHCRRLEREGRIERVGDEPVRYEPLE